MRVGIRRLMQRSEGAAMKSTIAARDTRLPRPKLRQPRVLHELMHVL